MAATQATTGLILGVLALHPSSGYDLKKHVDDSLRPLWRIGYGQLYPELRRLARDGLIERESQPGPRRRTVYRVTARGRSLLRRWLRESAADGGVLVRDELLLKLFIATLLSARDRDAVLAMLRRRHAAQAEGAERLRRHLTMPGHDRHSEQEALSLLDRILVLQRAYADGLSRLRQRRRS